VPYGYRPDLPPDAPHTRPVKWLATDLPRTALGQDLPYSLGTFRTVCEVRRLVGSGPLGMDSPRIWSK